MVENQSSLESWTWMFTVHKLNFCSNSFRCIPKTEWPSGAVGSETWVIIEVSMVSHLKDGCWEFCYCFPETIDNHCSVCVVAWVFHQKRENNTRRMRIAQFKDLIKKKKKDCHSNCLLSCAGKRGELVVWSLWVAERPHGDVASLFWSLPWPSPLPLVSLSCSVWMKRTNTTLNVFKWAKCSQGFSRRVHFCACYPCYLPSLGAVEPAIWNRLCSGLCVCICVSDGCWDVAGIISHKNKQTNSEKTRLEPTWWLL